jgi:predicted DNA repair protein MutK
MKNYVISFVTSILSFFMPIVPLLLLVGLFICIDTLLGVWSAKRKNEKITSRKLGAIIPKMLLYQGAVLTGYILDVFLLGEFISFIFDIEMLFTKLIAMTLIFIEIVSIDENFEQITGKNLFRSFKEMISRTGSLKKDIDNF